MANSPVCQLHEDLLWTIFMENTESYRNERLTIARYTSQVCQQWRRITLQSPSLWGRLIDMNGCDTYEWMRVVMSRAGNALLWITCSIKIESVMGGRTVPVPHFLLSFIGEKWANIQRLNVYDSLSDCLEPEYGEMTRKEYWTSLLKQPAPNLREFVFHYELEGVFRDDVDPTSCVLLPTSLFSSTAPALKKFDVYRHGRFNDHRLEFSMDMPSSWFSKLRSFTLGRRISLHRLLQILNITCLLEYLEINSVGSFTPQTTLDQNVSMITLPRLFNLHLQNWDFSATVTFLGFISPAPGCSLSMKNPSNLDIVNKDHQQLRQEQIIITKYIQAYFEYHQPTSISLYQDEESIRITHSSDMGASPALSAWVYRSLAKGVLSNSCFSTVREITLCIECNPDPSATLDLLQYVEPSQGPIFPSLRVIKFGNWRAKLYVNCKESLHSFLRHRRDACSSPISVLDLSALQPGNVLCTLDSLEEFTGLRVIWKPRLTRSRTSSIKEYSCGSGRPQKLCFGEGRLTQRELRWCVETSRPQMPLAKTGWAGRI